MTVSSTARLEGPGRLVEAGDGQGGRGRARHCALLPVLPQRHQPGNNLPCLSVDNDDIDDSVHTLITTHIISPIARNAAAVLHFRQCWERSPRRGNEEALSTTCSSTRSTTALMVSLRAAQICRGQISMKIGRSTTPSSRPPSTRHRIRFASSGPRRKRHPSLEWR